MFIEKDQRKYGFSISDQIDWDRAHCKECGSVRDDGQIFQGDESGKGWWTSGRS